MKKQKASVLELGVAATLALSLSAMVYGGEAEWVSLFDGKRIEGFTQRNGTATYRVEDGAITGETTEVRPQLRPHQRTADARPLPASYGR